ncbi:low molecular weight phosphatase family protein [Microbacterium sp. NPDC055910]|uniref:arsenate-mycothiol transferase ArsC n=1 Tax=Microbacterium sp. NPDC055910 TaxID=3345659 RepID=UPI0035E31047
MTFAPPGDGPFAAPVRSPEAIAGQSEILFVCHGNQCRSPYAAAIAERLGGGRSLRFHSAGLIEGGRSMPTVGRALAARIGYDFTQHRSRELDAHDMAGFDLVLTAAREQAREVIAENPDAWPRVFTIKQFARWIQENPRPPRAALGSWLDAAAADRPRTELVGADPADDVADPLLLPERAWTTMVDELTRDLTTIIEGLAPTSR